MKLTRLLSIPIWLPLVAHAAPYYYPYNAMTGEQVVKTLLTEPSKEIDYIQRDMTHSYVNGLKDGTQGNTWCFVGAILPHELNIELAYSIKATRTAADLKGNAAPLVLAELRKRYPCQPKREGTP